MTSPKSRIFYLMYDLKNVAGGEKHSYQHVDVLNFCGFDAYALHGEPNFRYSWFVNDTKTIDWKSFVRLYDIKRDYLVISETRGLSISEFPGRKVIFNKNLYQGYSVFGKIAPVCYPYASMDVSAVFAVSEHNLQHLRFAFPNSKAYRMYAHINSEIFSFRALAEKKKQIAVVAKSLEHVSVLQHTLMARAHQGLNRLSEYDWVFLSGYSETEVAKVLQDSLILISLSTNEGLQRTILEGMSCGCLIVAYGVGQAKEYLPREYSFEPDDFITMAKHIEDITESFPANILSLSASTISARCTSEAFSLDRQKDCLVHAWNDILV